jgi:hypothetical protein
MARSKHLLHVRSPYSARRIVESAAEAAEHFAMQIKDADARALITTLEARVLLLESAVATLTARLAAQPPPPLNVDPHTRLISALTGGKP